MTSWSRSRWGSLHSRLISMLTHLLTSSLTEIFFGPSPLLLSIPVSSSSLVYRKAPTSTSDTPNELMFFCSKLMPLKKNEHFVIGKPIPLRSFSTYVIKSNLAWLQYYWPSAFNVLYSRSGSTVYLNQIMTSSIIFLNSATSSGTVFSSLFNFFYSVAFLFLGVYYTFS